MKEKQTEKIKPITVKANKKGRHIMPLLTFVRIIGVPFYYLVRPFRYYGTRKVKDGPCVYISNHYTLLDPVYVIMTTPEGVHFISKKETFDVPVLGWFMRSIKAIKAGRDGKDVRTVLEGLKCLKNGEKVGIYPEGTRNKSGEGMLPFHHGAVAMAIRAKVPVIPIVMYTKPRFFRCTHILIGDPWEFSEYYDRKLTEEDYVRITEEVYRKMTKMREEHTQYLESKKRK